MTEGGSFLGGTNPLTDNLALFLLQVVIIISISRLVAIPLHYLRQPTVISEVIGGIILGPSVLSRFPAFKSNVFPNSSLPILSVVANFGLVLFLFLVGLELDPTKLASQFKKSAAISLAGITLPFAAGVGVSKIIYDRYADHNVQFTSFFVFCGVAMSITAFPVLARILTERKLLKTEVGQATLAAAASDDAMAWCLLALVVALIHNPSSSIVALYVFLAVVAWAIFLWIAIRPILKYLVHRRDSREGISQSAVLATFVFVCVSAWFTQAVGVHAIFGGFLIGIITPHDNGFAIKITEKVEDLISILFLPLYFAYSGLNFSIDSVNDASAWAMVVLVIAVACGGKIIGCTSAAKLSGLNWRESFTVGLLMNTKGLVELIVLNLGLQAGVINTQIFTIFVIMALFTTFMTVPIVSVIYPMSLYQNQTALNSGSGKEGGRDVYSGENDGSGKAYGDGHAGSLALYNGKHSSGAQTEIKVLVCLTGMRSVPAMMNVTQMMSHSSNHLSVYALRLVELTNRFSKVMMATEGSETLRADPVVNVFRTFGQLNKVGVRTLLAVAELDDFAHNVVDAAKDADVNLLIYPVQASGKAVGAGSGYPRGRTANTATRIFRDAPCSVALLVDRGFGVSSAENVDESERQGLIPAAYPGSNQRIFMVFFGGEDDCEAGRLAGLLATHPGITLTVLAISFSNGSSYNHNNSTSTVWGSLANVNGGKYAGSEGSLPVIATLGASGSAVNTLPASPVETSNEIVPKVSVEKGNTGAISKRTIQEEGVLASLAAIPGTTVERKVIDEDPLELVLTRADTFGPKDMIIIGRGQYIDASEWQAPMATGAADHASTSVGVPVNAGSAPSTANSGLSPPPIPFSGTTQTFRNWLDNFCVSSVMVVQRKCVRAATDASDVA
ncbi:hypothetical protein BASA50_009075 [Batrachochytrium salamandrivorans]|uniref:Cation/H+ exchanger domain-containing protein n=1 Tax=Batrachochytrium salamandrivorans TaxID=1357716 RepID=A0ABQ8F5U5_9FUNG|nr:hypothetical protein BASA50_009075 [Batrachochytrium salamandrivorans]KAH9277348.1 hypothetical protein BASA83_000215 [Batrachochytrium salamandrivorans]KAJ1343199.1 hypothetical protein BSLG_002225 [Batrachochytrium salamandrivorans]